MGGKTSTASKQKYNAKTYDRLVLNLRMDSQQSKQAIEQAAQAAGESTTAYVVEAVRRRMEQEGCTAEQAGQTEQAAQQD